MSCENTLAIDTIAFEALRVKRLTGLNRIGWLLDRRKIVNAGRISETEKRDHSMIV